MTQSGHPSERTVASASRAFVKAALVSCCREDRLSVPTLELRDIPPRSNCGLGRIHSPVVGAQAKFFYRLESVSCLSLIHDVKSLRDPEMQGRRSMGRRPPWLGRLNDSRIQNSPSKKERVEEAKRTKISPLPALVGGVAMAVVLYFFLERPALSHPARSGQHCTDHRRQDLGTPMRTFLPKGTFIGGGLVQRKGENPMKVLISTFAMATALAVTTAASPARAPLSRIRKTARKPARCRDEAGKKSVEKQ